MKAKYALVVLLVTALALIGTGCKATGGGWFINEIDEHKITFGFNAQPVGDDAVKGKLQLVDHDAKTRIHGTFTGTAAAGFVGTCSINGTGNYDFYLFCGDFGEPGPSVGDSIEIGISWPYEHKYQGVLQGGNIKGHKK